MDDFDGVKEVEQRESDGDSQENWSLGRLEEYKALQSSIKWMGFDMFINLQDVCLKCAGKGFKTVFALSCNTSLTLWVVVPISDVVPVYASVDFKFKIIDIFV